MPPDDERVKEQDQAAPGSSPANAREGGEDPTTTPASAIGSANGAGAKPALDHHAQLQSFRKLAESAKPPNEIVTELYLTTLSRPPTEEELKTACAAFNAKDATRQTATEDVFWALLNSAEFVFNH